MITVFIRRPERLYQIFEYINRNETGWHITLVCCRDESNGDPKKVYHEIESTLPILQKAGVFPHFKIDLIYKDKQFGPDIIAEVSKQFQIHPNRIFIGSIHYSHEFDYHELFGARIIFN